MSDVNTGWRKRQIALDIKADNPRELGLDYEPHKTVVEMAQTTLFRMNTVDNESVFWTATDEELKAFADLIRADEREACARVAEQVGQDKNQHGIAAAIRNRGQA